MTQPEVRLLTGADVRRHADALDVRPTKSRGQNFVTDPNTVRRIVRLAGVQPGDAVLEVGPGLGSLTLGLLEAVGPSGHVTAVEIDPALASGLPGIVAEHAPSLSSALTVVTADALRVTGPQVLARSGPPPNRLVANLPYNVAVPVLLHLLAEVPTLASALVMVQWEVAQRLAADPGGRDYGIPSVKAAWFGDVELAGRVGPNVFWPVPHVDSGLVRIQVRPRSDAGPASEPAVDRADVFACVDAAFSQRRKTVRSALARWAGGRDQVDGLLAAAEVDPRSRAETLAVADFVRLAAARNGEGRPAGTSPGDQARAAHPAEQDHDGREGTPRP